MIHQSVGARAEALARAGHADEAAALLERSGTDGEPQALVQLAVWRLMGLPVARDLGEARRLLMLARRAGDVPAAVMEASLTANGTGAPADWAAAVAILREVAARDRVAAAHVALLEAMAIDAVGAPTRLPDPEPLVADGSIRLCRGFLSQAECEHVARGVMDLMKPATVVNKSTGQEMRHPHRTSDDGVIGPTRETLPIQAILRRIAVLTGTAIDQGEQLTVLRYAPGQEFRSHFDALGGTGNQRTTTVLLYLNQGFQGGETVFPRHDLVVTPVGGDALVFSNTLPDGRPDPRALHAGLPVRAGHKWLATRWIRARPFSVWTGPEVSSPH